jgi:hypothetical protein
VAPGAPTSYRRLTAVAAIPETCLPARALSHPELKALRRRRRQPMLETCSNGKGVQPPMTYKLSDRDPADDLTDIASGYAVRLADCLQLHQAAATTQQWRSPTPIRTISASWRTE